MDRLQWAFDSVASAFLLAAGSFKNFGELSLARISETRQECDLRGIAQDFELDRERTELFLITHHPKGWLKRKPLPSTR